VTSDLRLSKDQSSTIRVVDLFSGCGGLSLGFDLFEGSLQFETVLAIDVNRTAVRCFNQNSEHGQIAGSLVGNARVADINWFHHPSEILLYYLLHLALRGSNALFTKLKSRRLGILEFLGSIKRVDDDFQRDLADLYQQSDYKSELSKLDSRCFTLAIVKAYLAKVGLASLRRGTSSLTTQLWSEECSILLDSVNTVATSSAQRDIGQLGAAAQADWETGIAKLESAGSKSGRGQHKVVNARVKQLVKFLRGPAGSRLAELWIGWKSQRDSIRAAFSLEKHPVLESLYADQPVQLVLGGPPCKGFSRIARPVMQSLRSQGVSAWTSHDYGDERNALLHQYVLFLLALRPDCFVFENVSNFRSTLRTPAGELDPPTLLAQTIEDLSDHQLHYEIRSEVVRAKHHAVPQDRDRFIMAGLNAGTTGDLGLGDSFFPLRKYEDEVPLLLALQGLGSAVEIDPRGKSEGGPTGQRSPAYTLLDESMPQAWKTYISWIRQSAPGHLEVPGQTDAHIFRQLRADDLAMLKKFGPGQRWMDYRVRNSETIRLLRSVLESLAKQEANGTGVIPKQTIDLLLERTDSAFLLRLLIEETGATLESQNGSHLLMNHYISKGHKDHGDWFERLSATRPSKTIIAHIGKDTYSYFHPYEHRSITIREAARIQTFPDFFSFSSIGIVDAYSMIGDAVPPLLANAIAARICELHEQIGVFGKARKREGNVSRRERGPTQLTTKEIVA
jgi:site-specific DNA-cytosine methylase